MNKTNKPAPIGRDVKKVISFHFGMYRYQAEHFDHNEKKEPPKKDELVIADHPMKRGTKIYRFIDFPEYNRQVAIEIRFSEFLSEEDIKKGVLEDTLDLLPWDPYDFQEHFLDFEDENQARFHYMMINAEEKHVDHGYPECEYPYKRCPICGGELDESVLEADTEDVFNSFSGSGPDGGWSRWEEIHRCPHCGKRFFIEEST